MTPGDHWLSFFGDNIEAAYSCAIRTGTDRFSYGVPVGYTAWNVQGGLMSHLTDYAENLLADMARGEGSTLAGNWTVHLLDGGDRLRAHEGDRYELRWPDLSAQLDRVGWHAGRRHDVGQLGDLSPNLE